MIANDGIGMFGFVVFLVVSHNGFFNLFCSVVKYFLFQGSEFLVPIQDKELSLRMLGFWMGGSEKSIIKSKWIKKCK